MKKGKIPTKAIAWVKREIEESGSFYLAWLYFAQSVNWEKPTEEEMDIKRAFDKYYRDQETTPAPTNHRPKQMDIEDQLLIMAMEDAKNYKEKE